MSDEVMITNKVIMIELVSNDYGNLFNTLIDIF